MSQRSASLIDWSQRARDDLGRGLATFQPSPGEHRTVLLEQRGSQPDERQRRGQQDDDKEGVRRAEQPDDSYI